jgi:elongation factor P
MDTETFDQIPVTADKVGDADQYLKENDICELVLFGDEVIGVELPITVELRVAETDPGFKGDTATGGSKPATLETGLVVQVPLFVEEGTVIRTPGNTSSAWVNRWTCFRSGRWSASSANGSKPARR